MAEDKALEETKTEPTGNKWNQSRRLEFIDFRLAIDGKINRKDLVNFFSISVPQASLDLSKYHAMVEASNPPRRNLVYDRHLKVYLKTDDFKPLFPKISAPQNYLNDLLQCAQGELADSRNFFGFIPTVGMACFTPPRRHFSSEVLYNILEAIRTRRAVHINYMSVRDAGNVDRLVAPHGLAYDGMRWHVRAYCYDVHAFRDYVLSRIVKCAVPQTPAPNDRFPDPLGNGFKEVGTSNRDDSDWNDLVDLVLKANPELPAEARRAIEYDYGMPKNGTVVYTCRRALLFYALNYLRLNPEDKVLPPMERQLALENEAEVYRRVAGGH
ncbi:MAG: WYL domain-containing protein [Succinivibrio sp.]|jgi:hypothetical protein|nr:WYL domain-containing protein [Succinivibrio sp.]